MHERILVPVDGSAMSTQGLDEAIKLAKLTGAGLRLVHVVDQLTFATGYETCTGDVPTPQRWRGSSASRRPSPSRLNDSTSRKIDVPGQIAIHGALST